MGTGRKTAERMYYGDDTPNAEAKKITFTIATPTYNRANVLERVYTSLKAQTYRDFEWIIVDDGSIDHTKELVNRWVDEAPFPIRYFYQENSGKHMALNCAVRYARGEFFIIADSDDTFKPESLQVLLDSWNEIPEEKRNSFRGVTCRCYDPETGKGIGSEFPDGCYDQLGNDATYRSHYQFDMWGFNRTEVMREYPFPDTSGQGLAFYPETIIWDQMGEKYYVRFINSPLLAYYHDQLNSTNNNRKNHAKENIYLWEHYINDVFHYFWYQPKLFIKAFVGLSMDGLLLERSVPQILSVPNKLICKIGVLFCMPLGYVLYRKRR